MIALEACMISPETPQGARKVFMPHIGRLWEASGWWKKFWRWLFGRKDSRRTNPNAR
jgi:hypothetical protein